jgi:hypothetical protein
MEFAVLLVWIVEAGADRQDTASASAELMAFCRLMYEFCHLES